jgi:hypothetical protein
MAQNGFSKMTELSVNAAGLLVNSAELSVNATEFRFFWNIIVPFTRQTWFGWILANFTKFSENRQDQPPLIFLLGTNFQTLVHVPSPWVHLPVLVFLFRCRTRPVIFLSALVFAATTELFSFAEVLKPVTHFCSKFHFVLCKLIFLLRVLAGGFPVLFLNRQIKGSSFLSSCFTLVVGSPSHTSGVWSIVHEVLSCLLLQSW